MLIKKNPSYYEQYGRFQKNYDFVLSAQRIYCLCNQNFLRCQKICTILSCFSKFPIFYKYPNIFLSNCCCTIRAAQLYQRLLFKMKPKIKTSIALLWIRQKSYAVPTVHSDILLSTIRLFFLFYKTKHGEKPPCFYHYILFF